MAKRHTVSDEDRALFRKAAGEVRPVEDDRYLPSRSRARRPARNEQTNEPGWDASEPDPLAQGTLETGDVLWFARPGLQHRLLRRLRRGQIAVEAALDLHGKSTGQAHAALVEFLRDAREAGRRCVCVIHGKGYGSRRGGPVIKTQVNRWLRMRPEVVAYCSALPADGGTGAVYVLLRR